MFDKFKTRNRNDTVAFRVPEDLRLSASDLKRILVIGSCLAEGLAATTESFDEGCPSDFILFNNFAELPASPPRPIGEYDFQLVQVPLRSVLPDYTYFRLPFGDVEGFNRLFDDCCDRLRQFLDAALAWNEKSGILTFVTNFMLPQQNLMGRLLPRNDLRNFVYFVDKLNALISEEAARRNNVYLLDIDQIAATYGRKYFQDDVLWQFNHGSALTDSDHALDRKRIQPPQPASQHYTLHTREILQAWWRELIAGYRTVRQIDSVKLVVVDLDDTLWRGLVVEEGRFTVETTEGWPLGFIEALSFLKKRGILLAILSKNDEAKVADVWPHIMLGRMDLSDFAVRKINWQPKAQNLAEIFDIINVLPRNTVFIDDNPVERASISSAYPDLRVLGSDLYYLRRILLWSAETQVAAVSAESGRRTEMIQAQAERESSRKRLSRDEFLATLDLRVHLFELRDPHDPRMARAIELVNKSNQFNSTGRRWTSAEINAWFAAAGVFYAFEVTDRFTQYGLVGVAIVSAEGRIEQFVMSCRVIGLDIEVSVIGEIGRRLARQGRPGLSARFVQTDANQLVHDLYPRCGMASIDSGLFSADSASLPPLAGHITLT
ncbi:MAG: HAD-IIIC family phosphatase [Proteobacteria bacterium]|uniref:HAD-IIIC family phosphatase n=1 Tax=Rudaea sp. TaxID=2136325 RepID=UPI00321F7D4A|nr:HAD-IIIC family phosphatase [Pseudomonadota bacterium]